MRIGKGGAGKKTFKQFSFGRSHLKQAQEVITVGRLHFISLFDSFLPLILMVVWPLHKICAGKYQPP
jgi:hypothetical protein